MSMSLFEKLAEGVKARYERAQQRKEAEAFLASQKSNNKKLPVGDIQIFCLVIEAFYAKGVIDSQEREAYALLALETRAGGISFNNKYTKEQLIEGFLEEINKKPDTCVRWLISQWPRDVDYIYAYTRDAIRKNMPEMLIEVPWRCGVLAFVLDAEKTILKLKGIMQHNNYELDKATEARKNEKEVVEALDLLERIKRAEDIRYEISNLESSTLLQKSDNDEIAKFAENCLDVAYMHGIVEYHTAY